uniref:Uncharacterized protein n=1 Tax=Meleagris gallopavo TaxID=9103 RepID=A0A803YKU9_MELGA
MQDAMEIESSLYTDFIFCNRTGWRNIVHDNQKIAKNVSARTREPRTLLGKESTSSLSKGLPI